MTRAAFGDHLDLHAGGVDLAFPHHENEIAQWRGCNNDLEGTWCKCWLHTGHLHIEGRKMSKSLKNFVTVRELLDGDDAVDPEAFRIFCGLHRYASTVSYSRVKLGPVHKSHCLYAIRSIQPARCTTHGLIFAQARGSGRGPPRLRRLLTSGARGSESRPEPGAAALDFEGKSIARGAPRFSKDVLRDDVG